MDIEGTSAYQNACNKTTTNVEMENNQLTPPLMDGGEGKKSNNCKTKIEISTNDDATMGVAKIDSGGQEEEQAKKSKEMEAIPPSTKELHIQTSDMSDNEKGIISPMDNSNQGIISPIEEINNNDTSYQNVHARAKNQRQQASDHSEPNINNGRVAIRLTPIIRVSAAQAMVEK